MIPCKLKVVSEGERKLGDDKVIERRVEILKLLHGKEMRIGEIAEHFNVSDVTIRKDIDALRVGLDILGFRFKIESKHWGSQKHYYKSTVHPIMLGLNLSELLALLKALEDKSKGLGGEVYKNLFYRIYNQMTNYAEGIISPRLEGQYDKKEIINNLEEEAFMGHRDYKLAFWNKSGRYIKINYMDKNNNPVVKEVMLHDIQGDKIKVKDREGREEWFTYGDIAIDWSKEEYK